MTTNTKYKVLLCEDEVYVARSYVRKLELEGFEVIQANNGVECIEFMQKEKPDLVILDLMMPLQTGFETLEKIKNGDDADLKKIPIIVASNLGQQSDIDEAAKLGAVDFLVKSNISLKELIEKVNKYLPKK